MDTPARHSGAPRRVLIVDDARVMRALVRHALQDDPGIEVVGEAEHAVEARELLKALKPDVLTLDIEMPRMRGDIFLRQVMTLRPTPVIMLSSQTQPGSPAALSALAAGAFDCIGKPQRASDMTGGVFAQRLRAAVHTAALPKPASHPVAAYTARRDFRWNGSYVFIGSSTGGVNALERVLGQFPANYPPTVIAQHMPPNFIRSLADWLNARLQATVKPARDGQRLAPGYILIAPGGNTDLRVLPGDPPVLRTIPHDEGLMSCPSVDVLFDSAASLGSRAVGVILTGMGRDGARGLGAMRSAGGRTMVQDEATCVVYGMPRAAMDSGAAEEELSIDRIGDRILALCEAS